MSLLDLCGIEEGVVSSLHNSLDFSLAELNEYTLLYRKEDIITLENSVTCDDHEWKEKEINVVVHQVYSILVGDYEKEFNEDAFKLIVLADRSVTDSIFVNASGIDCIVSFLKNRILGYINLADNDSEEKLFIQEVIHVALTLLNMYVQANYTGPQLYESIPSIDNIYPFKWFKTALSDTDSASQELKSLEIDGEYPYTLMKVPLCLSVARAVLIVLSESDLVKDCDQQMYVKWWLSRCDVIHHRCLLGNPSPSLLNEIHSIQESIEDILMKRVNDENEIPKWLLIRILIERGLCYLYTYETEKANPFFLKAMHYSKLECELTGVKGRLTKYQTFDTSQLLVYANSHSDENMLTTATDISTIPVAVSLDEVDKDNILLERMRVSKETEDRLKEQSVLTVLDQIIIQCLCIDINNNNPKCGLITEQIASYVNRILVHPRNWTVYSYSLLLKSYGEYENSRTKERAILQLQVLVDQLTNETTPLLSNKKENNSNAPFVFITGYPPFWEMKKRLADHYFQYGVVMTAMDIYRQLEMFEEVVNCLEISNRKDEAIKMLQERIQSKGETPYLVCRLGELTKDMTLLEHAWSLSSHHFARAKRDLGEFCYEQNRFDDAIVHFRDALAINMLYPNIWFKCAVAAMRQNDFTYSITCFTTLLRLNPEFGEGWSNLAGVLMKVGKFEEAYEAACQSVRFLRQNWRVWDNFITISMLSRKYASVIEGLNMLLDIKDKNEMNLDYSLLSDLTVVILTKLTNQTQVIDMKSDTLNDDTFADLSATLSGIEEKLDEEYEEEEAVEGKSFNDNMGSENDRQFLIIKLTDLFDKVQKMFPRDVKLYDILSYFYLTTGQTDKSFDALLKKTRSNMTGNYLASEETAKSVLSCSSDLLSFVIKNDIKKKSFEVKMLCRSIVTRCEVLFSGLEEFKKLQELLKENE